MIKKNMYVLVLSITLYSCSASSKDVIQFKNMFLSDYYYIDDQTKTLQCYSSNANIISCYSLNEKEKLWEFLPDKLAYDRRRSINYMYNSFDGNILISLKQQESDKNNICIVNTVSGNVLKKLDISGYVYYTAKDGGYLYAVIGVNNNGIDKDELSDDVLIIKIDLYSFKYSIIFKLSNTGQLMKYKSTYLNIHLPLVIIDDAILCYTYYPYCANNQYCLYSINKHSGNIYWKKNVLSNFAVDSINPFIYFVNDNYVLTKKNIKTGKEFIIIEFEKKSNDVSPNYNIMIKSNIIFIYDYNYSEGYLYNDMTKQMIIFSQLKLANKNISLFDRMKSSYYILYDEENIIYWDRENKVIKKYNFIKNNEVQVLKLDKNKDVGYFEMYNNGFILIISSPNMSYTFGTGDYDAVYTILLPKEFYE